MTAERATPTARSSAGRADKRLRVLAVVELGGNWGHLLRLRPVIDELRSRGHVALLATPDVAAARRMFGDDAIEIVEWPTLISRKPLRPGRRMFHYAQMLERCAFGDAAALRLSVQRWNSVLRRLRPDVMLLDFAPGALFASHLSRLPVVQAVMGWEAPRAGEPLPTIRRWSDPDVAPFERLEAALLANLNRECAQARVASLACVSDLYRVGTQLLATWPEIDHFGPRDEARYIGPIYTEDLGEQVAWAVPDATGAVRPRVLVYLARDPRNEAIVAALAALGAEVIAVLPDVPRDEADRLHCGHVRVFDRPIRIAAVVAQARLAITNGGHGVMGACLRAGVPMLLMPRFAEQALLATRVAQSGLAQSLLPSEAEGAPDLALLARALADPQAVARASAIAARHAGTAPRDSLLAVVAAIERAGGLPGDSDLADPAVDGQFGAVDERALVAGEKQRRVGDVDIARDPA